ncbi:MAG TPA: ATP-binding protein [Kofleriaceae bacterium]|nr:ATP-binding protein [Kofleriaceae bacterium]
MTDAGAALTNCDLEPIHIPGTIQTYGVLLVLAEPALTVTQVSDNVEDHFALGVESVIGQSLSVLLDPTSVDDVRRALCANRLFEVNPLHLTARGRQFDGIIHRHDGATILELEPSLGLDSVPASGIHHPFRTALLQIERVGSLSELANVVVEQMRQVTAFERVMFYRFHGDGHGSVDAEAKDATLEPYLGLNYPASDIPAQARRLYLSNWLRLIFDARSTPARVVPTLRPDTGKPLDLSYSVLRGVSPVHLEYMANMGTRSAMSISLIVRDRLWGLVSCVNHSRAWRIPHDMRAACEFIGRLTSLQIAAFEDRALLSLRAAGRATAQALGAAMRESTEVEPLAAVFAHPAELMGLVAAEGAALVSTGGVVTCGRTPSHQLIEEIAAWLDARGENTPFSTDVLVTSFPRAREASDVASGLLTFALPGAAQRRLLWFRPELIRTVHWGGDPTKSVQAESGQQLRPRHSFAVWKEEVRLHSHPWTASDLEAVEELQRRAIEVDLERRLASEQRALRAREDLLAVVSHDLKSPLSSILLQADVMSTDGTAADNSSLLRVGVERIQRSANHMKAMVDDLLDLAKLESHTFALHLEPVDSRRVVEEALRVASPLADAKRITVEAQLIDSPGLNVDAERIFRVLSNLVGNAIKFSPAGATVTVRTERSGAELLTTVVDHGPGIAADALPRVFERYWKAQQASKVGSGLGLYIAKGIVEAHGGRIWAECSGGSTRFMFTLPLTAEAVAGQRRRASG